MDHNYLYAAPQGASTRTPMSVHKILSTSGCPLCLHTSTIKFSRLCTKPILFFRSEGKHVSSNAKQARACYLMIRNIFFTDMHGLVRSWSLRYTEVFQNRDPVLPAALGGLFWIYSEFCTWLSEASRAYIVADNATYSSESNCESL